MMAPVVFTAKEDTRLGSLPSRASSRSSAEAVGNAMPITIVTGQDRHDRHAQQDRQRSDGVSRIERRRPGDDQDEPGRC